MSIFSPVDEKGYLIETWSFEGCDFIEFKLRYYNNQFILWRYIPKQDVWKREAYIEAFLIKEAPVDWAEKFVRQFRGIDESRKTSRD